VSNEEILRKAIKKAQKNGWYSTNTFRIIHMDGSIGTSMFLQGIFEDDGHTNAWHRDVETLIFNSYFAKAFWGEEVWNFGWNTTEGHGGYHYGWFAPEVKFSAFHSSLIMGQESWRHHLQQMVLEEDPIKYLEQFLDQKDK